MKQITITEINMYLESKDRVWSRASYNSEAARLRGNLDILNMEPELAFTELKSKGIKPYTIKTMFIRFGAFIKFLLSRGVLTGANKWQIFLDENPQVFRNVYEREVVACNYKEAVKRINSMTNADAKTHAMYMLKSGLRIHETYKVQIDETGAPYVVGKGGKRRKVYMKGAPKVLVPQHILRQELAKVGLKPHGLRKIIATELFNRGDLKAQDLCRVMGWSKLETAMSYLQTKNDAAIMKALDLDGSEHDKDKNRDVQW